jgi:hypothetical protein
MWFHCTKFLATLRTNSRTLGSVRNSQVGAKCVQPYVLAVTGDDGGGCEGKKEENHVIEKPNTYATTTCQNAMYQLQAHVY